jgi:hypothetical protein
MHYKKATYMKRLKVEEQGTILDESQVPLPIIGEKNE